MLLLPTQLLVVLPTLLSFIEDTLLLLVVFWVTLLGPPLIVGFELKLVALVVGLEIVAGLLVIDLLAVLEREGVGQEVAGLSPPLPPAAALIR